MKIKRPEWEDDVAYMAPIPLEDVVINALKVGEVRSGGFYGGLVDRKDHELTVYGAAFKTMDDAKKWAEEAYLIEINEALGPWIADDDQVEYMS